MPTTRIHGILVQMPLPKQIDSQAIIRRIAPEKDVDGFHPENVGKSFDRRQRRFPRRAHRGELQVLFLEAYGVKTAGMDCVIVGRLEHRGEADGEPDGAARIERGLHGDGVPQSHA